MSQTELRAALADDLAGLARLHEREIDRALIDDLLAVGFPDNLALLPDEGARQAMRSALDNLQENWSRATFADGMSCADALAADYAGIYLNGACTASPYESVWLSDEHLTCQLPMFELRALYEAAGLAVDDWRKRYDDHFVLQFQYLAHALRDPSVGLETLGRFLDEHVGYWFPDFAAAVVKRGDTDFYRSLAVLTAAWLENCRALIEQISGEKRTPRAVIAERLNKKAALASGQLAPIKFMPGGRPDSGPSW
jgi:putative dimethyl sulfoxide reductase chaperone